MNDASQFILLSRIPFLPFQPEPRPLGVGDRFPVQSSLMSSAHAHPPPRPDVIRALLTTVIHRLRPDLEPFRTAQVIERIAQAVDDVRDSTELWVQVHLILNDLESPTP